MKAFVVAAVAVLVACGKSKSECKREADDLGRFLAAMDHDASFIHFTDDMHLVERPELTRRLVGFAPIVELRPRGVTFGGELVGNAAFAVALRRESERIARDIERDIARGRHVRGEKPNVHLIYLEIDRDATWLQVTAVADAAMAAGFDQPVLIFGRPATIQPPPRTWVDDEVDTFRKSREGAATKLAGIAQRVVKSCDAVVKLFGSVGASERSAGEEIIAGLGPALVECGCDVDMAALRSTMWNVMGNPRPTIGLAVTLSSDGAALALPAATKWSDASKRLAPDARVHLAISAASP